MLKYLEAMEIVEPAIEPAIEPEIEPEFIRAEVTDKMDAEIEAIKAQVKLVMVGLSYRLMMHYCNHDTGGACESKLLEGVNQ